MSKTIKKIAIQFFSGMLLVVVLTPTNALNAGGFGDLFKSKARELVDKSKEIAIKKAAKVVFPLEADSASARSSEPLLDHFSPVFESIEQLKRTSGGGFKLRPGSFEFIAQSYCLKPGTYQRPGGNGYMSGPIKGKLAPYITQILRQSWKYKHISQQDIQYLLWGLIAGASPKDMNPRIYQVAKKMLSRKSLQHLNGGVEGQIPDFLTDEALARLPEEGRKLYDTYREMKRLAAQPDTSFEDLERIAVLPGEPPQNNDPNAVPDGRWTYHPDGYFIRYFSNEYFKTRVQIVVPEKFKLVRDQYQRISNVIYSDGSEIKTIYDDNVKPKPLQSFKEHAVYKIKQVIFRAIDKNTGKMRQLIRENTGFIIAPLQQQQLQHPYQYQFPDSENYTAQFKRTKHQYHGYGLAPAINSLMNQQGHFQKTGNGLDRIYQISQMINDWQSDMEFYRDRARAQTRPLSDQDLYNIVDLDHYQSGARSALGETADQAGWLIDHLEREQRAIARATQLINDLDKDPSDTEMTYLPWMESGLPGSHSYSQRRGISGRSF